MVAVTFSYIRLVFVLLCFTCLIWCDFHLSCARSAGGEDPFGPGGFGGVFPFLMFPAVLQL